MIVFSLAANGLVFSAGDNSLVVVAIAAIVTAPVVTVTPAGANLIDVNKVPVVVDMNVVAETAFAGVEAIRQGRSLEAYVVVPPSV